MAGAIVVAERGDAVRIDLDAAGRSPERVAIRIGAKVGEEVEFGRRRISHVADLPESFEIGTLDAVTRCLLARNLIEVAEPFHLAALFGEGLAKSEALGHRSEDVEIVARLPYRIDGL